MVFTSKDADVKREVLDDLRYDVRIDESAISVDVTNGTVHLTGKVPNYFQKVTAGHDTRRINGVRRVINDLQVCPIAAWTDLEIGQLIRRTLDYDSRLADPSVIDVAVSQGVVTLMGSVDSPGERMVAAGDAWVAPGITDVVNNLTIQPTPPPRGDDEITSDILQQLKSDALLDATNITVAVVNGTVHLRGTVPRDFDRRQAQHDAWWVRGIRDVVDEMGVAA